MSDSNLKTVEKWSLEEYTHIHTHAHTHTRYEYYILIRKLSLNIWWNIQWSNIKQVKIVLCFERVTLLKQVQTWNGNNKKNAINIIDFCTFPQIP